MARAIQSVRFPLPETYSEIVDVRSPGEFAEDRVPGAINLPVLDDGERARVGTIYKQESPFVARKLGAGLVAGNISRHVAAHFLHKGKDYRPLIYCWRGGMRSNSLALVLSQVGWSVSVLDGGYKTYRAHVRDRLANLAPSLDYRVLCGLTGSGKTRILQRARELGVQVLDLEGLANHRGSLLGQEWNWARSGDAPQAQPSQKWFESQLLQALEPFDPKRPVWTESESNRIGSVHLPPPLWMQMQAAPCVEVCVPIAGRVQFLLADYPHLVEHPEFLCEKLSYLKERHGKQQLAAWFEAIAAGRFAEFVEQILVTHYDPTYRQSLERDYYSRVVRRIDLSDLSSAEIDRAARVLAAETSRSPC